MTTPHIEQAIRDAEENGWRPAIGGRYGLALYWQIPTSDPAFWQALGKARGWKTYKKNKIKVVRVADFEDEWKTNWHRFIDHLAEVKDSESFFKDL